MIKFIAYNLRKLELTRAEKIYSFLFLVTTSIALLSYCLEPIISDILSRKVRRDAQVIIDRLSLVLEQSDSNTSNLDKLRQFVRRLFAVSRNQHVWSGYVHGSIDIDVALRSDLISGFDQDTIDINMQRQLRQLESELDPGLFGLYQVSRELSLLPEEITRADRLYLFKDSEIFSNYENGNIDSLLEVYFNSQDSSGKDSFYENGALGLVDFVDEPIARSPEILSLLGFSPQQYRALDSWSKAQYMYGEFLDMILVSSLTYHIEPGEVKNAINTAEFLQKLSYQETPSTRLMSVHMSAYTNRRLQLILRKLPSVPIGTYQRFSQHDPKFRELYRSAIDYEYIVAIYSYIRNGTLYLDGKSYTVPRFPLLRIQSYLLHTNEIKDLISKQREKGCKILMSKEDSSPLYFRYYIELAFILDLSWEHTLKILQAKELGSMTGKYPDRIAGIEQSQVCPDLSYTYRVLDNGTRMSLSLTQVDDLKISDDMRRRLTYETKLPIKRFQN